MVKPWNSRMAVLFADTSHWQGVCSGHSQFIGEGMTTKIQIFYSNFYRRTISSARIILLTEECKLPLYL